MENNTIFSSLKNIALLQDLPEQALSYLGSLGRIQHFDRNEYISLQGHGNGKVLFIQKGTAKVVHTDEDGREYIHNIIGEGYLLPGASLFSHESLPASVQSMTDSTVIVIPQVSFEEVVLQYPCTLKKLIMEMNRRIYQLYDWQQKLAVGDSNDKMMSLLNRLADEHGNCKTDGIHIKLPITQMEMAQIIGVRRESLNRMWSRLQKKSVVVIQNNEWILSSTWRSQLPV